MDLPFVLLAAGRSQRMGGSKALLDYFGKPWLLAQIERIRAQTEGVICVVLAPQHEAEANLLSGLAHVQVVLNPAPDRGPFSSLQAGLAGLTGSLFVGPLDCPVAPVLAALWAALKPGVEAVIPLHQGRGGHPVLVGPELLARLSALNAEQPEARLDHQLHEARLVRVPVQDSRIVLNLNSPEAWADYLDLASHQPGS